MSLLTDDLRHVLCHALGLNPEGAGVPYRNRYVARPDDWKCLALVELGYMEVRHPPDDARSLATYSVTELGAAAARRDQHARLNAIARHSPVVFATLRQCGDAMDCVEALHRHVLALNRLMADVAPYQARSIMLARAAFESARQRTTDGEATS